MNWYKVIAGYECRGPEDGMMCSCGEFYFQASCEEQAVLLCDTYNAGFDDYLGCCAELATSEEVEAYMSWLAEDTPFE